GFGFFQVPAIVYGRRNIDGADLIDRRLHVADVFGIDAVIRTERASGRIAVPAGVGLKELHIALAGAIGPQRLRAGAVAMPALLRAATAGAFVILAGPFVVDAREVVKHARADRVDIGDLVAVVAPLQIIDHGGQPEAGAGAFVALIQDETFRILLDLRQHQFNAGKTIRQRNELGLVHAIAQVDAIGAGVKGSSVLGQCRHDVSLL